MPVIRPEVLRQPLPDGGLALYDPLLERLTALSAAERALLERVERAPAAPGPADAPGAALLARLAGALLVEGPVAEGLRARVVAARLAELTASPPSPPTLDPALARGLPLVAATWRAPEAWRRLAEERAAGRTVLVLRGFLPPRRAAALGHAVAAAPTTRFATDRVVAWRQAPDPTTAPLAEWLALIARPELRALVGGVLGAELPPFIQWNAWRLEAGDHMRVHPDGRRYAATWALGLCPGWTARDGGAIAFGVPGPDGLDVRERWLPFLGDLCLFVPHAESWHAVEPPRRTRLTLSGWWARG